MGREFKKIWIFQAVKNYKYKFIEENGIDTVVAKWIAFLSLWHSIKTKLNKASN